MTSAALPATCRRMLQGGRVRQGEARCGKVERGYARPLFQEHARKITRGWIVLLALVLAARPAGAQGRDAWLPRGTALGVTVDRSFIGPDADFYTATFHVSALNPGRLGPEFGVSVLPRGLPAGILFGNLDGGVAFNLPLPHATVLVRGGGSALYAFGRTVNAVPGVHYGASLVVRFAERSGLRIDVIRRVYFPPTELAQSTLTIGVGITSLPGI